MDSQINHFHNNCVLSPIEEIAFITMNSDVICQAQSYFRFRYFRITPPLFLNCIALDMLTQQIFQHVSISSSRKLTLYFLHP